jgi:tetratricopeptide (TPR) repeat protein
MSDPRGRRWIVGAAALIVLGVALVYAPVRDFAFVSFDDPEYVAKNPHVRPGLWWPGVVWAFTRAHSANWHPLTWLSHMADWSLFGAWAGGHHLTSVVLHAASAVVLLLALVRLTGAPWESAIAAAAFALHPLRVESVAWVSERKDVLATLAWVLAMLAYARYVAHPSLARYAAVAGAAVMGLLAKPMVVTLPAALLLLDAWPLGRLAREPGRAVLEKIPLVVLSAAVAVVTYLVQSSAGAVTSVAQLPIGLRLANALLAYASYLVMTIWPARLAMFYPQTAGFDAVTLAAAALTLIAVTVVAWRARRSRPYLLVGWLWYLGTLVPVIGLVRAGDQAMADRFTYIPSIGLGFMGAWTAGALARRSPGARRAVTVAAAATLVAWGMVARAQVETWRDDRALYTHALAVTSGNHVAHGNLGLLLLDEGRVDEAIAHFQAAIAAHPEATKPHLNLGVGLATKGDHAGALAEYERAVRADPRYATARYNLGLELATAGRVDEAIAQYEEAIRLDPEYPLPHVSLGLVLADRGRIDEAIAHYRAAIALDPERYEAYNNLAVALERNGAADEAIAAYREGIRLRPDDARAHFNLGAVLLGQGRAAEAAAEYREVVRLVPSIPEGHAGLGDALSQLGDRAGALQAYRRALELRPDWTDVDARVRALGATPTSAD